MLNLKQITDKINKAKNIALFAHNNPDADAYGSMFAMQEYCKGLNKNVEVFAIKNPPCFLDEIFPLVELCSNFSAKNFDLIICLDMHTIARLSKQFLDEFKLAKNVIVIDHHKIAENDDCFCKNIFLQPEKAATCEIIADMFCRLNVKISPKIATYLWAGIMGDTDRFLHDNLNADLLRSAANLLDMGADAQLVYDSFYRNTTLKEQQIWNAYLKKMKFYESGKVAAVIFTLKDAKKLGIDINDVKKFANEIVRFKGVEDSILVMEYAKNDFKVSLRADGNKIHNADNALRLSQRHGGGGHLRASGFELQCSLREMKKKVVQFAKELVS